ncbi:hypothetical protein [Myxococcus xanthus]|nr:hypothetical protein [Myxococcus xanthus]
MDDVGVVEQTVEHGGHGGVVPQEWSFPLSSTGRLEVMRVEAFS